MDLDTVSEWPYMPNQPLGSHVADPARKAQLLELGFCEGCWRLDIPSLYRDASSAYFMRTQVTYSYDAKFTRNCSLCGILFSLLPKGRYTFESLEAHSATYHYPINDNEIVSSTLVIQNGAPEDIVYPKRVPDVGLVLICSRDEDKSRTQHITPIQGLPVNRAQVNYPLLSSWLSACDRFHSATCKRKPSSRALNVPLRCIDCCTRQVVQLPDDDSYIALSYVWGSVKQPMSFKIATQFPSILPEKCAQVVEDAITLVINIGQRYLWVDQFCINQNDHDTKALEISEMDKIYEGAYATIIAGAGEDANYGPPGVSRPRAHKQQSATISNFDFYCTMPPLSAALQNATWSSRGWTYQEAVLSRRCIIMTDFQAYFACQSMTRTESVFFDYKLDRSTYIGSSASTFMPHALFGKKYLLEELGELYVLVDHIAEYTKRNLKFKKDSLDAFRGLLARSPIYTFYGIPFAFEWIIPQAQNSYLDGAFGRGLWWSHSVFATSSSGYSMPTRCPTLPSWSWAGWKANVYYITSRGRMGKRNPVRPDLNLQDPQFWLKTDTQLYTFQEIITNLRDTRVLPEISDSLIIETEVYSFSLQYKYGQVFWCPDHPQTQCDGASKFCNKLDSVYRGMVSFLHGASVSSQMYQPPRSERWDCLLLAQDARKSDSGDVKYTLFLMIVEWEGEVAYRVGNLQINIMGSTRHHEEWPRTRRRIQLG